MLNHIYLILIFRASKAVSLSLLTAAIALGELSISSIT